MRILVITNLYPPDVLGGYEMGCRQAVDALRAAGHEVFVLTSVPRSKVSPAQPHIGRQLQLTDVYDTYFMGKASPAERVARHHEACVVQAFNTHILGQVVDEFRPDVAYVWNVIGLGGLGLLAAIQHMGVPWVMHLMDDVPRNLCALNGINPVAVPEVANVFDRVCRGRFICCSRTTVEEIEAAGVKLAGRTTIIPNWVTTTGTLGRNDYRPDGHLRMMFAGAIANHKGADIVIRAMALLRDRGHTNFSLDMFGWGHDPAFRTMIQAFGLQDAVRIRGARSQDELERLFPQHDVFLFPTWEREPFGFAPLEAMAHGCVVVMSRLCGVSEWVLDGADCVKVERTAEALAIGLEQIMRGDLRLEVIGRQSAQTVQNHFHLSTILPQIELELTTAVKAGGGPQRPAAEAYRLALLAEKTFKAMVYEAGAA